MARAVKKQELGSAPSEQRAVVQPLKRSKVPALLVTADEALWPQVGADLSKDLILKQLDSIDELIASSPSGQAAIVLWDARGNIEPTSVLSRLSLHSARYAVIALDTLSSAGAWTLPIQHRQIVAHVGVPIAGESLAKALDNAYEEMQARVALLGESNAPAVPGSRRKPPILLLSIGAALVLLGGAIFALIHRGNLSPAASVAPAPTVSQAPAVLVSPADNDEKVDQLIERAQQAMNERHFIDPAAGSALSLYREVLIAASNNGEARQGLSRLHEILISRVQAALDDRKFDVALQSLETARSLDAADRRLAALDEKIASLRAELGPAQIMAAINAQNFDRATQLIEEAARSKFLNVAKLSQLREEVRHRRDEADDSHWMKLVDSRLQQDHLFEPRNDSAAYYLEQARQAGIPNSDLQPRVQELLKRAAGAAHSAIELHRFADADHLLTELHSLGAPASTVAGLQRDLGAARGAAALLKPEPPSLLEIAQSRLAQGKLTDPENDSALYYLNQLRAQDSKNPALPQLTVGVQSQILERAHAALDAGDSERADALFQRAQGLGASADVDALAKRLHPSAQTGNELPTLMEQSLTRASKLDVQYPQRPMQAGIEGYVELGYTVNADGTVSNISVIAGSPKNTFDKAATKAVKNLRYQPVIQGGKAVAVSTQLRVVFRIPK